MTPPALGRFSWPVPFCLVHSQSGGLTTTTATRNQKPSLPRRTWDLPRVTCLGKTLPRTASLACLLRGVEEARVLDWSVVVPVKRLESAKTRLAVPLELRPGLVLAMAADTVAAARSVARVLVISDDPRAEI